MLVEALVVITIALIVAYLIMNSIGGNATYQGGSAVYNLNQSEKVMVLENRLFPWGPAPCALRFGIFITQAPKTVSKVDCISLASNTTVPTTFSPSCTDNEYKKCACAGVNCSRCSLEDTTTSYLSKLLNIGDNLEYWASGYTSQNDKTHVPALLKIRTAKDSANHYMESVSLPAIPLQKWTIITIVKEGRRFDIYYGANRVASKLLEYIPVPPDGSRNWFTGHPRWQGKIGFFNLVQGQVSDADVEKDLKGLVNTRGIPYYLEQMNFSFQANLPEIPSCVFGNCNMMPEVIPQNPFAPLSSDYS